ncbi:putative Cytochrome P450 [Seiridium cardinale]
MAIQKVWDQLWLLSRESDPRQVVLMALEALLASAILIAGYRLFLHPLSHVPGPFLAKLTGLWRSNKYFRGNWHEDILDCHRRYGRVVRIAPNELSVVDEQAMKDLYGHGHNAPKTSWYSVWDPPETAPQLFSELDKSNHSFLRKRLTNAYSMTSIMQYEKFIQDCLSLLLEKLEKYADAGETVNMSNWTNAFAFDVVGELGFGEQMGHLRTETDVDGLRKNIFDLFAISANMGYFPGQMFIITNRVTQWIGRLLRVNNPLEQFRVWSTERIQRRFEKRDSGKREDLLAHFCRMKNRQGGPASFGEVLIEALNLVGAGADTTSIGMRACLYYVARNPDVYKRLQEEVDAFYRDNKLDAPITYAQTQTLPYLQAVVKEATRILPSIVFQLPRYAPPDFSVRGIKIPENTHVGISPIAQNRDQDIWGPDADEFKPDRWLQDPAKARYYDRSTMTFGGSGPRMCIGKNIALVELHKFLAQFIHHYDFDLANKERPWHITTYWFAYQYDLFMHITRRQVA